MPAHLTFSAYQDLARTTLVSGQYLLQRRRLWNASAIFDETLDVECHGLLSEFTHYSRHAPTTYKRQTERMQRFLREANAFQERQRRIIEGLRGPFAFETFRTLLEAEGFATLPRTLAARMRREAPAILVADEKANHRAASTLQPIGGVCMEVLDLLQDCVVPPKMFGLLREVVPRRQVEIAQLMIALERVKLNFARVLIALTPLSQRTDPSLPSKRFGRISATQLSVMEIELAELTQEFLVIAERDGMWNLEYMAALGYLNRLMDSPKVVRYLAQKFPAQLAELQNALDTASSVGR